jgi:hypothetical protein
MRFNRHSTLVGLHAFLSASDYHWINYDQDKLDRVFVTRMAAKRGTEMHELAHRAIRLGVKLPMSKQTINIYVNDGIGFKMTPEVVLFYTPNCFGTADLISFRNGKLRIHDLKTGATEASFHQLEVYAALFCLEYNYKPNKIEIELRIYQNDEVKIYCPEADVIFHIMDKMITFNRRIEELKEEMP